MTANDGTGMVVVVHDRNLVEENQASVVALEEHGGDLVEED